VNGRGELTGMAPTDTGPNGLGPDHFYETFEEDFRNDGLR
jgi:hypothetical protein